MDSSHQGILLVIRGRFFFLNRKKIYVFFYFQHRNHLKIEERAFNSIETVKDNSESTFLNTVGNEEKH